jgi:hypothetical protein
MVKPSFAADEPIDDGEVAEVADMAKDGRRGMLPVFAEKGSVMAEAVTFWIGPPERYQA